MFFFLDGINNDFVLILIVNLVGLGLSFYDFRVNGEAVVLRVLFIEVCRSR